MLRRQVPHQLIDLIQPAVSDDVNRHLAEQFAGCVQTGMSELVDQDGVVVFDEHRQRSAVAVASTDVVLR